jgi:hypothetical protein
MGVAIVNEFYSYVTAVAIKKEETLISKGLLFYSPLKHLFKLG